MGWLVLGLAVGLITVMLLIVSLLQQLIVLVLCVPILIARFYTTRLHYTAT